MAATIWVDDDHATHVTNFEYPQTHKTYRDRLLIDATIRACEVEGISYSSMSPIQRMFATHYRCNSCKMLPLYFLDFRSTRRAKCGVCGHHVPLKNSGKYGRVRKQVVMRLSTGSVR